MFDCEIQRSITSFLNSATKSLLRADTWNRTLTKKESRGIMSSSPRRSTPGANFGDDPVPEDQGTMQDIAISGEIAMNEDGGDPESQPEQPQATVLDKSALRRYSVWITLMVASSIAYASLAVEKRSNKALGQRTWSFAVLGTTMIISLGVTGCFVAPDCNPCTKAFVSSSSSTARFFELFLVRRVINFPKLMLSTNKHWACRL